MSKLKTFFAGLFDFAMHMLMVLVLMVGIGFVVFAVNLVVPNGGIAIALAAAGAGFIYMAVSVLKQLTGPTVRYKTDNERVIEAIRDVAAEIDSLKWRLK